MLPRLVVLDSHTLSPGDLSWEPFSELAALELHPRSGPALVKHARGARLVLTNKERIGRAELQELPELEYIGVLATGVNVVDLDAARERGVAVTFVPGYAAASVAQHVFALLLELTNRVAAHSLAVGQGDWSRSPDFSFTLGSLPELTDKRLGIVGLGATGLRVARIGAALGMRIAASASQSRRPAQSELPGVDVDWLELDRLFAECDVVSLHCPLSAATEKLVSAERLSHMRNTAYLINTGRGGLVDESALVTALRAGQLAGAGLDVLSTEPPAPDNPVVAALSQADSSLRSRLVVTPHVAWATLEARERLMRIAAQNLKAFLAGASQNRVA